MANAKKPSALGSAVTVTANWMAYPAIISALTIKSEWTRLRALANPDKVHWQKDYAGQPIMLVALFQKGRLRPDIVRLLQAAKAAGHYVLAVNTLRLKSADLVEGLIDCYIERFNFGRDFGSYKTGFQWIAKQGWDKDCPRLLMVNDSVFFTESRLGPFLESMMTQEVEVLGSTENYELSHHLGSFCIAMDQCILRHEKFKRYWRQYRLTDVRPRVIHNGEMGLSKVLRKCVSSPNEFKALFTGYSFLEALRADDALMDFAIQNARTASARLWKRVSFEAVLDKLKNRYLMHTFDPKEGDFEVDFTVTRPSEQMFVNSRQELIEYIEHNLPEGQAFDAEVLRLVLAEHLVDVFMSHSQIHQNAILMLHMGLPIVKLDGVYRGMFSVQDIERICRQIGKEEAGELSRLLLERPDGATTLHGWRYAAFMRGLI